MPLDELQAKIDASMRNASALMRELFSSGSMDAATIRDFVNDVMSVSVATVLSSGRPHSALTLIACSDDGDLYFAANERSVLFRNLQRSAHVALTVDAREHGLMAQGQAELVGYAPTLRNSLLPELDRATRREGWLPDDWTGAIYRVHLHRIFGR